MSAFKFSLEQVLSYRRQLEEQAMQAVAQAVRRRDRRLREKEECEAVARHYREKLTNAALLDAQERWLISEYVTALAFDIEKARQDLALLEEEIDNARVDLTRKTQQRKLLERLKEKQATRHKKAEFLKEQQEYDDTATIRFMSPAV